MLRPGAVLRLRAGRWDADLFASSTPFRYPSLQDQRGDGRLARLAPIIRLDHEPEVGHSLGHHRPLFALERRTRWAEIEFLAQQFPIGLPAVARGRGVQFLGAYGLRFLDLQSDLADRQ